MITKKDKQILNSIIDELQVMVDANEWTLNCPGNDPDYVQQTLSAIKFKNIQIHLLESIMNNNSWIKTKEQIPTYEQDTPCLVWYKGEITILYWNSYYKSWDTADGDDHECDADEVEYWMPLPDEPNID